jgi:hypothetical protein
MLVELHAIEEVLLCAPSRVNLCIATDSWAVISSVNNWHKWSDGRRRKFAGEAIMRCIHLHMCAIVARGNMVAYQHLYSHILEKKRLAWATGPEEMAKLKHKLRNMKDQLWGAHSHWTDGNVGADLLAGDAHRAALTHDTWTMGREGRAVVLFDHSGREVSGNIRKVVLSMETKKWPERMRRKPVHGCFL